MSLYLPIPGYKGFYEVSDTGLVRSIKYSDGKILKPYITCGYQRVNLYLNGIRHYFIHRLVMLAFVGKCPQGMEVCHNDGNPLNNSLGNLRYDTKSENAKDIYRKGYRGNRFGRFGADNPCSRKVSQYSSEGVLLASFDSILIAGKETGIYRCKISECCKGIRKNVGGFIFQYQ